ncbi:MAG: glycerol-3-phosphate dehydrogenase [Betaproteobacteria bacterium RBG_16_64_18]|nr:MAG: glycerol-3-phosphate dehydrogenase [Betaproteobacteria bacterium RBG_16_64_18]OGA42363.1 MAG: glycerol-3-phosphate dehydrogenase [Betaproteobacteria bacterium RIFCSPLOWO2_12_FULL_65_110]
MNIAILGAGAWGTALAIALSARHAVTIWARDPVHARALEGSRCNARYLPQVALPGPVGVTENLERALQGAVLALVATPTSGLRETLAALRRTRPGLPVVWACKGFERSSALLPHEIAAQELGQVHCGALSGPSFALEVAQGRPTALTLASRNAEFARATARELHQPALRVYFSTDLAGVEIGGAVKNVMAIATGICDGLGLGLNARAALITRGLAEITRLGVALGGRPETFMGLAGAGDLILTCTGDPSRNRRVGLMLAQGHRIEDILSSLGHVAEGVYSAQEVQRIATAKGIQMPITQAVCEVLYRGVQARQAVQSLLARDPKEEVQGP